MGSMGWRTCWEKEMVSVTNSVGKFCVFKLGAPVSTQSQNTYRCNAQYFMVLPPMNISPRMLNSPIFPKQNVVDMTSVAPGLLHPVKVCWCECILCVSMWYLYLLRIAFGDRWMDGKSLWIIIQTAKMGG